MAKLYIVTCYGEPAHVCFTRLTALNVAEAHIRDCPQGAMPWAKRIVWYETDVEVIGHESYVSVSRGEYLNHIVSCY